MTRMIVLVVPEGAATLKLARAELVKKLQEFFVADDIIEASSKDVQEEKKLACLDASHILKDHIHEISFLDHSCALRIVLMELAIKL